MRLCSYIVGLFNANEYFKLNTMKTKMKEQNNNIKYLEYLWVNKIISSKEYFFRLQANSMDIKTYKDEQK